MYQHNQPILLLLGNSNIFANHNTQLQLFSRNCIPVIPTHIMVGPHQLFIQLNIWLLLQQGATPLQVAALKGHTDVVKFLVDNRADINAAKNVRTKSLLCMLFISTKLLYEGCSEIMKKPFKTVTNFIFVRYVAKHIFFWNLSHWMSRTNISVVK